MNKHESEIKRVATWRRELDRRSRKAAKRRHQSQFGGISRPPVWLQNPLLAYLGARFRGKDISRYDENQGYWVIKIPKDFSFGSNPNDALDTIYSVIAVAGRSPHELIFDHRECVNMDLGASAVLDIVAINLRLQWRTLGKCTLGGWYPENERVREAFVCMGMTKHLHVTGAQPPPEIEEKFFKFPLIKGRRQAKDRMTGGSDQESASTKLAEYLNECFEQAANYSFSVEGQRHVLQWASEIITNAEEHSKQAEWYTIAYMRPISAKTGKSEDEAVCGECQLVIFNFGESIYESLSSSETPTTTHDQIAEKVAMHSAKNYFFPRSYSPEDLWTLYALQDGVSRFSPSLGEIDRGKGTVRMIGAFQALGDTLDTSLKPEMTLISGASCIHFTKRYQMRLVPFPGGSREIIAFNDKNSLDERPDSKHVHSLTGKFPGTLLTFRFFIDKRYLDDVFSIAKTNKSKLNDDQPR